MLALFTEVDLESAIGFNEGMKELDCVTATLKNEAEILPELDWPAVLESIRDYEITRVEAKRKHKEKQREWRIKKQEEEDAKLLEGEHEAFQISGTKKHTIKKLTPAEKRARKEAVEAKMKAKKEAEKKKTKKVSKKKVEEAATEETTEEKKPSGPFIDFLGTGEVPEGAKVEEEKPETKKTTKKAAAPKKEEAKIVTTDATIKNEAKPVEELQKEAVKAGKKKAAKKHAKAEKKVEKKVKKAQASAAPSAWGAEANLEDLLG